MPTTMAGGCQCGRIRFEAEVASNEGYLCHCRMCQRATGGVSIAFANLPQVAVRWLHEPDWFSSSPIASRPYCATCGTPLGFKFKDGENIDLTVGSFDDPSHFIPVSNFGVESKHDAWEDTSHLPGTRCKDWEPTASRWITKIGRIPK